MELFKPNDKTLPRQAKDKVALRIVMDGIIMNLPKKDIVRIFGILGKDPRRHPLLDAG
jgi:hypothetical protein